MTFNFDPVKVCSPAIFETCLSYDKDIWIVTIDYYVYLYTIVLFLLATILQYIFFLLDVIFST